jgi:hypothetical protein
MLARMSPIGTRIFLIAMSVAKTSPQDKRRGDALIWLLGVYNAHAL